jgi:predicted RNA-binding Zn ribbon-like protein
MVTQEQRFLFRGGHVALDLVNTVGWRLRADPLEFLPNYEAIVVWLCEAQLLAVRRAAVLLRWAKAHPGPAVSVARRVRQAREVIYGALGPIACDKEPEPEALRRLDALVHTAARARSLQWKDGRLGWSWSSGEDPLLRLEQAQLVWSTAQLVEDLGTMKLRQCAGDPCGWLFLDTSNRGTRRWCSMSDCGNVAKVRRHRQRLRDAP